MQLYTSGLITIVLTAISLVTFNQRMQKFYNSFFIAFWIEQGIFFIIMLGLVFYTLKRWDSHCSKKSFWISCFFMCILYIMAWTDFKLSGIIIFIVGLLVTYYSRKSYYC